MSKNFPTPYQSNLCLDTPVERFSTDVVVEYSNGELETESYKLSRYNAQELALHISGYTPAHSGFVILDGDIMEPITEQNEKLSVRLSKSQENFREKSYEIAEGNFYSQNVYLIAIEATTSEVDRLLSLFNQKAKKNIHDKLLKAQDDSQEETMDYMLVWNLNNLNHPNEHLFLLSESHEGLIYELAQEFKYQEASQKIKLKINAFVESQSLWLPESDDWAELKEHLLDSQTNKATHVQKILSILPSLQSDPYNIYLEKEALTENLNQLSTVSTLESSPEFSNKFKI